MESATRLIVFPQKMLQELCSLPPEVLSHHMASLHSKDNPQGSPALLLLQLLLTPHLLSNIWQNERFEELIRHNKFISFPVFS